jgi:FkbM family methyltransferase
VIEAIPPISSGELDLALLKQLLGTDAPLILEIGANDGTDTVRFLRAFPDATVYAFEPDPRAVAKFKARGYHPRLHLFEIAIGAEDGEADFYSSSGLPSNMPPHARSLKAPKNHKAVWRWVKF